MNLAEVGEYWARWQPEAVAIATGGVSVTWSRLEDRTRRIAGGLRAIGVRPGDRVGILGANSLHWCELALGTMRAGAAVVPLNVRGTTAELAYLVDNADLAVIAYDSALAGRYGSLAADRPAVVRVALDDVAPADTTMAALRDRGGELPEIDIAGADPAVIAFTSGTTGYPKGAVLTHQNLLATINAYTRFEGYNSDTTMLCCVPLAFTGGIVNNFLTAYGVGGTLLLEEFDPARALELIVDWPVNAMTGVPIMYEAIAAAPGFDEADLSALTTAITGGALVPDALLRRYEAKGVQIRQAYSLTEATGNTTLLPRSHFLSKRDSAGIPGVHTRVRIVDASGVEVATGEVGEIVIQGPQVSPGYWNDPGATAAAVVDGWLHTGDVGTLDDEGFLRVVDRKKDMIISGGLNVYPAEIERVVAEFPGVAEVAAVGTGHERWGETVAVVVTGDDLDLDTLYQHCRENLADYKVPRYITHRGQPLPRGMSGKILRRVLRDEFDAAGAHRTAAR
ncbi:MAG: fatty-acyl-CoA synthase [Pseudonocardiales bacterium]|nr:fatty-acyl-CoA synthase [Pseudonocardiales bacterium]